MDKLVQGVRHFQHSVFPAHSALFADLAHGQAPEVMFIACSDSRVDPSLITQTPPGRLFVLRNAGQLVPPPGAGASGEAATLAYAINELQVHHLVVCGHSGCGAVQAVLSGESKGQALDSWLAHAGDLSAAVEARWPGLAGQERWQAAVYVHVLRQLEALRAHPCVVRAEAEGRLRLHGWVYDIPSGGVQAWEPSRQAFVPLTEAPLEAEVVHDLEVAPPALEPLVGQLRAVLVSTNGWDFEVAQAVSQILGVSQGRASQHIQRLPAVLLTELTELEAEVISGWIGEAGGEVRIEGR